MEHDKIKLVIAIFGLALFIGIVAVVYQEQRTFADLESSYIDEIFPTP